MSNYLFLTDSKIIISKLKNNLPNYYKDKGNLLKYEYDKDIIYLNKFYNDRREMMKVFARIGRINFKFKKIFLLLCNVSSNFKLYANGLAHNLVKLESDVIIFEILSIKSDFNFDSLYVNCNIACSSFFGCHSNFYYSSNCIYVQNERLQDIDYHPDYFIKYFDKTIKSEKIIRDEENKLDDEIPIVIAKPILDVDYKSDSPEPSAPPL